VYFESAYYPGPGEGGEKPYRLLADALASSKRTAIAQLVTSGKEQLVLHQKRHSIIDLRQALKQSIEKAKPMQKTAPAQRKRKTASSDS
jgi:non-homologous end joining protein Ku